MKLYWAVAMAVGTGAVAMVVGEASGRKMALQPIEVSTVTMPAKPTEVVPAVDTPTRKVAEVAVAPAPAATVQTKEPNLPQGAEDEEECDPIEECEVITCHVESEIQRMDRPAARNSIRSMVDSLRNLKQGSPEFNAIKDALYSTLESYINDLERVDPQGCDEAFVADLGSMLESDVEAAHWASMWALGGLAYRGQRLAPTGTQLQRIVDYARSGTPGEKGVAVEALDRMREARAFPLLQDIVEGQEDARLTSQARVAVANLMNAYPVPDAGGNPRIWWERLSPEIKNAVLADSPTPHPIWRRGRR